jgi:hypothetical protein
MTQFNIDDEGYARVEHLLRVALNNDGSHHKQWYLERLAEELGFDVEELMVGLHYTPGIAP